MSAQPKCDRCPGEIPKSEGHLFYSSILLGLNPKHKGVMFLCGACADRLVCEETYQSASQPLFQLTGVDLLQNPTRLGELLSKANNRSVVLHCQRHGFSPAAAKQKAHELARSWWENPETGLAGAIAFWKNPPPVQRGFWGRLWASLTAPSRPAPAALGHDVAVKFKAFTRDIVIAAKAPGSSPDISNVGKAMEDIWVYLGYELTSKHELTLEELDQVFNIAKEEMKQISFL